MSRRTVSTPARAQWVWLWVGVSLCVAAAALVLAGRIVSPWSEAAANSQAEATATTRVVQHHFAGRSVSVQGTVSLGARVSLPAPEIGDVARLVVTEAPLGRGDHVRAGQLIAAVSGRPVFGLNLRIPLYRDLAPGDIGPDVASLQESLAALGLYSGSIDGEYGTMTGRAVGLMYERAAHTPPPAVALEPTPTADETSNPGSAVGDVARDPASDGADDPTAEPTSKGAAPTLVTPLRMAEIADLPTSGGDVESRVAVGTVVSPGDALVTLRTGTPHVTARIGVSDKDSFAKGARVAVSLPGIEDGSLESEVSRVSAFQPGNDDGALPGYDITVIIDVPAASVTSGAQATIDVGAADGGVDAPALPIVAIREDSGGTYVILDVPDRTRVGVELGVQADGYVQLEGRELAVGDPVLIGDVAAGSRD